MSGARSLVCTLLFTGLFTQAVIAQEHETGAPLAADERRAVVQRLAEMLVDHYVFPDVAERCSASLLESLGAGEFDQATDREAFATRLTGLLRGISHDKHLRVDVRSPRMAQMHAEDPAVARSLMADNARQMNYGFARVEHRAGNVGYVDMRVFDGSPEAKPTAAAAMNFIGHTDAVIFDMRFNRGGSPDMVRYVTSWFFDEPTHLNSLYFREGDRTMEFWTLEEIPGTQRPDVPLFVLTSAETFSAAEEFSYNLRTRERATLVGETTAGGANPGGTFDINEGFSAFIPGGRAINPITGTNWEGVGVVPHVQVPADEALDTALELARSAAEDRRARRGSTRPEER